jgi:hypothetical protein
MPRFETLWAPSSGLPGDLWLSDGDFVLRQAEPGTSFEVWREGRWEHYPPSQRDLELLYEISLAEAITRVAVTASRAKV